MHTHIGIEMSHFFTAPSASSTTHDENCVKAADRFIEANKAIDDRSSWGIRAELSVNLFLWHLEAFEKDEDPRPAFVEVFDKATDLLRNRKEISFLNSNFPTSETDSETNFETAVSNLFSNIWVDMTDDIYFDQTFDFTKERFEKNGINPFEFFKDKLVVDAGCGSGKFSAAIAKFGAKKGVGIDIGEQGLQFAREQAKKTEFSSILDYQYGSLLDIPVKSHSVDLVWSNGVIHHTLGYEKCICEFNRILKGSGQLFLYVNGSFGLFELLQDKLREANADIPRGFIQTYLKYLNVNSGRLYWLMDNLSAPYEWKSNSKVRDLLLRNNFTNIQQLMRGVASDQIEQVTAGLPYADIKYGESQLKYSCTKRSDIDGLGNK